MREGRKRKLTFQDNLFPSLLQKRNNWVEPTRQDSRKTAESQIGDSEKNPVRKIKRKHKVRKGY